LSEGNNKVTAIGSKGAMRVSDSLAWLAPVTPANTAASAKSTLPSGEAHQQNVAFKKP
jgi:hypothetical protein